MNVQTKYKTLLSILESAYDYDLQEKREAYRLLIPLLEQDQASWLSKSKQLLFGRSPVKERIYYQFVEDVEAALFEEEIALLTPEVQRKKRRYFTLAQYHNARAREHGAPATLTAAQWEQTLHDFHERCAYCRVTTWEHMDHFIPISRGGGTTQSNCVPACRTCNLEKGGLLVEEITTLALEDLLRVQAYLTMRSENR